MAWGGLCERQKPGTNATTLTFQIPIVITAFLLPFLPPSHSKHPSYRNEKTLPIPEVGNPKHVCFKNPLMYPEFIFSHQFKASEKKSGNCQYIRLVSQEGHGCPDCHKQKWAPYHFKKVAKYYAEFWKKNNKKGARNGTQITSKCLLSNLSPWPS